MNDKQLENVNTIDLEFSGSGDDDSFVVKDADNASDKREPIKTGVIITFDDEDDINISMKKHTSTQTVNVPEKAQIISSTDTAKDYNEIDLDCKYADDTEDDYIPAKVQAKRKSMFDDDDESLDSKELVLEDSQSMFAPRKVTVTTIEDDFWKELSKKYDENEKDLDEDLSELNEKKKNNLKNQLRDMQKLHQKSNKKGAAGMSFHFAGNPQKERDMFNAGIGKQNDIFPKASIETAAGSLIGGDGGVVGGGVDGVAATGGEVAGVSGGISNGGISAGGMSGGESLKTTNYGKMLKEVFDTIGFDVAKNQNGELLAKDLYNDSNTVKAKNISDLIYALQPFIETCIIIPLSIYTKENFTSYKDWSEWYTEENKAKYPKYNNEVKYCDLLANHLDECEL